MLLSCFAHHSFINNNNVDTSSINIFVTITAFPPSATIIHQQQQLEPEHGNRDHKIQTDNNGNREIQTCPTSATTTKPFMPNACKSNNNTLSNAIPIHPLNPSTPTLTCRQWRERKDVVLTTRKKWSLIPPKLLRRLFLSWLNNGSNINRIPPKQVCIKYPQWGLNISLIKYVPFCSRRWTGVSLLKFCWNFNNLLHCSAKSRTALRPVLLVVDWWNFDVI